MLKLAPVWLSTLVAFLGPAVTVADPSMPAPIAAAVSRLTQPVDDVPLPAIPANPVETLIAAVNTHSASLGFPVDHGTAIWASGISPEYAGRVALLMRAV